MTNIVYNLGESTIPEGEEGEYLYINLPRYTDGKLMTYTDYGMYPLFYFDKQCSILCPDCANKSEEINAGFPDFLPRCCDVNYEDTCLYCDDCSKQIPSAYGDDNEGDDIEK